VSAGGLYVVGSCTISGNVIVGGTVTQSSDRRLKQNFQSLTNCLEKVYKLRGVSFSWVDNTKELIGSTLDDKRHIGLIAQEVQEVFPEVVSEIHEGRYLGVDYSSLVPLLVESINELNTRTKILEARNEQLIHEIEELQLRYVKN
jgi:hypothetical protein